MIWKIDVLHTLEANTKLLIGLCCNVFCVAVLSAFQLLRLAAIFTGGQEGCFGGLPNFDSRWEVCCTQRPTPFFLGSAKIRATERTAWRNLDMSTGLRKSPWQCFDCSEGLGLVSISAGHKIFLTPAQSLLF